MDGDIDRARLCCDREEFAQTKIAGKSWKRSCGNQQPQAMAGIQTPGHWQGLDCRPPSPGIARCQRQPSIAIGNVDGLAIRTNVAQAYKEVVVSSCGRGRQCHADIAKQFKLLIDYRSIEDQDV